MELALAKHLKYLGEGLRWQCAVVAAVGENPQKWEMMGTSLVIFS